MQITELPEQMMEIDAVEEGMVTSLRQRVMAIADVAGHVVECEAVATHDDTATIMRAVSEARPDWTVLEWAGKSRTGLYVWNPRAWLYKHRPTNPALDNGDRFIREMLVYPEPGPDDALVVNTADHPAEIYGAELTDIQFVPTSRGADLDPTGTQARADYLDQVRRLSAREARMILVRGEDFVETMAKATAAYDLLLMGAPMEHGLANLFGTEKDRLTEAAACSVLRLQTPHAQTHQPIMEPDKTQTINLLDHLNTGRFVAGLDANNKSAVFPTSRASSTTPMKRWTSTSYGTLYGGESTPRTPPSDAAWPAPTPRSPRAARRTSACSPWRIRSPISGAMTSPSTSSSCPLAPLQIATHICSSRPRCPS